MIVQRDITRWEKIQRIIGVAASVCGMITPFAIFYLGYMISTSDERRQEQNRKFDILMRIGPSLLDNEPKKVLFALQIIDDAGLDKSLILPVLLIAKDAFRRPEVATQARDLIAKWVPREQLFYILSTNPDPNIRTAASEIIAQSSQPAKIQQIAESANPTIQKEAKNVLDAKWVVWIASMSNPGDADAIAKTANNRFSAKRISLTAEVSPPSDNGTSYWAVSVGKQISLEDAQKRLEKARNAGYADAFIAGFRW